MRLVLVVAALVGAGLSGACGSDSPEEPTISANVDAVRNAAAQAMAEVETVHFTIERRGAVVHVDEEGALAFERASGRFASPSSADAVIALTAGGRAIEVGAVAIGGVTWITNPVTGRWERAPESLSFDPATLFDPDLGWHPLLSSGLRHAELVEPAPDDENRYLLRGVADRERVAVLTGGLVRQRVPIDVWLDAVSGRVVEARFEAETPDGPTSWRLVLFDYGAEVVIERPDLGDSQ